jgi:hypothetical protein
MNITNPVAFSYSTYEDTLSSKQQMLDVSFKHGEHSCILEVRKNGTYKLFFVGINKTWSSQYNRFITSPERTLIRNSIFLGGLKHLVSSDDLKNFGVEQVKKIVLTVKAYLEYEGK